MNNYIGNQEVLFFSSQNVFLCNSVVTVPMYFPKQKILYWGKRGKNPFNSSLLFSSVFWSFGFNIFKTLSVFIFFQLVRKVKGRTALEKWNEQTQNTPRSLLVPEEKNSGWFYLKSIKTKVILQYKKDENYV